MSAAIIGSHSSASFVPLNRNAVNVIWMCKAALSVACCLTVPPTTWLLILCVVMNDKAIALHESQRALPTVVLIFEITSPVVSLQQQLAHNLSQYISNLLALCGLEIIWVGSHWEELIRLAISVIAHIALMTKRVIVFILLRCSSIGCTNKRKNYIGQCGNKRERRPDQRRLRHLPLLTRVQRKHRDIVCGTKCDQIDD